MSTALIIGSAKGVEEEVQMALALFKGERPDHTICINNMGITYPEFDHWVSLHAEHFGRWLNRRRFLGLPDPKEIWSYRTYTNHRCAKSIRVLKYRQWGGSSGMFGVQVALQGLHCDRIVVSGCPLTATPHFDDKPGVVWKEAEKYREVWKQSMRYISGVVKSTSGWTKELLGAPTEDWLWMSRSLQNKRAMV